MATTELSMLIGSTQAWGRRVLRFDGAFLLFVGVVAMAQEALGHFTGRGPLAHLHASPYTIGGFEAHGLAAILGFVLLKRAADADRRPWHWCGLAIHLLLGVANIAFWVSFTAFGFVTMGVVTTVFHAGFVYAHAYFIGARRTRRAA